MITRKFKSVRIKKFINFLTNLLINISDSIKIITLLIYRGISFNSNLGNLVLVTGSDSQFFLSVIQLLTSIRKNENNIKVIFYDLGLDLTQKEALIKAFPDVVYKKFDFDNYPSFFSERDGHMKLGAYAWKSSIIYEVLLKEKSLVLWLDAGNILNGNLNNIKIILQTIGFYSPYSAGKVEEWTHVETVKYIKASSKDLKKSNLTGGLVGFNYDNKFSMNIAKQWKELSEVKDCIAPRGSNRDNHRQDQSILSILFHQNENLIFYFKSKWIAKIKVNQNPGIKIYLSEGYGNDKLSLFRNDWYKKNNGISTNTIKMADIIWIISPINFNKIPKNFLKKNTVVVSHFSNSNIDFDQFTKIVKKNEKYINFFTADESKSFNLLKDLNKSNTYLVDSQNSQQSYRNFFQELINKKTHQ